MSICFVLCLSLLTAVHQLLNILYNFHFVLFLLIRETTRLKNIWKVVEVREKCGKFCIFTFMLWFPITFCMHFVLLLYFIALYYTYMNRLMVDPPRVDPPHVRPKRGRSAPNFWDVPPLVLGRSTPIKLHQILTEIGNNDDTPWAIAVGWIGNSNDMNVQHAPASSRLTPVEWADMWRHPSSMSRAGAACSAQQWSWLNVWSNAETGVNSPTHCWQTPCNGFSKCHIQSTCRYMASSRGHAEGQV